MGTFFVYILKSSVCLATFYLFYKWLLSKETFHRFNRLALGGVLVLSFLIPCCEMSTEKPIEFQQTVREWEKLFVPPVTSSVTFQSKIEVPEVYVARWTWQKIVLAVYLIGIVFFFLRNIYSLLRLAFLLRKSKRKKLKNGITLIIHDQAMSPFSWIKYIILSASDLKEGGKEIFIHEKEHIRHYHSFDLLAAEIMILFQWFNPAAWLFKYELQNIHEYEADEAVLNQGIDAKRYQLLLIKKAVGAVRFNSLANSFNHSKLKKRITMMLKRKSTPWAMLKYLYILPLAALAVAVFAHPEISHELDRISALKVKDLTSKLKKNREKPQPVTVKQWEAVKERTDSVTVMKDKSIEIVPLNRIFTPGKIFAIMVDGQYFSNDEFVEIIPQDIKSLSLVFQKEIDELYDAKDGILALNTKQYEAIAKDAVNDLKFPENRKYEWTSSLGTEEGRIDKKRVDDFFKENQITLSKLRIMIDGENASVEDFFSLDYQRVSEITLATDKGNSEKILFVRTYAGDSFREFKASHTDPLVILNGKEVSIDQVKRSDYYYATTYEFYGGDESLQFGPKAKDGALFIGSVSIRYQTDEWRNKVKQVMLYSSTDYQGCVPPDSLVKAFEEAEDYFKENGEINATEK